MSKTITSITYKGGIEKKHFAVRHIQCDVCGHQTRLSGKVSPSEITHALERGCQNCISLNKKPCTKSNPNYVSDGRSLHPLYVHYRAMIDRTNPNTTNPTYLKYYVARGITVCERWLSSFWNFAEDMGPKPTPKHTLDRLNNDQGYSPENCGWRTMTEQIHNRRKPIKRERK